MKKTTVSLIFTVLAAGVLHAENWPGWRGPNGTGVSSESSFSVTWDASNIRWKTPIPGRGHSSPIVWGDRIFLTTSIEGAVVPGREKKPEHKLGGDVFIHPDMIAHDREQTMKVLGLDAKTGKVLCSTRRRAGKCGARGARFRAAGQHRC